MKCEVATWVYLDENILTKSVFTLASSLKDDLTLHSLSLTILFHSFSFPFYMILHHSCNDAINQPNCFLLICRLQKHNFWEKQKIVREVGSKSCHAFSLSSRGGKSRVYYTIILHIIYHTIKHTANFRSRMEEQFRIIFNIATSSLFASIDCTVFSNALQKWPEYILKQELNWFIKKEGNDGRTYAWPNRTFPCSNSRIGSDTPGGPPAPLPATIAIAIFSGTDLIGRNEVTEIRRRTYTSRTRCSWNSRSRRSSLH